MSATQTRYASYDPSTIALHWLTAALIVTLWVLAQIIDLFPDDLRVDVRSLHIVLGVVFGFVLAWRIAWRMGGGRTLAPADAGVLHALGEAAHYALYVLMIAEVVLGLANVWMRGDSIFNLFSIPPFDPANKPLRRSVGSLHGTVATLILIVAGVHAVAALFHHYVLRDSVLERMLPWVAPASGSARAPRARSSEAESPET
jgi:cytochrome b561